MTAVDPRTHIEIFAHHIGPTMTKAAGDAFFEHHSLII